MSRRKRFRKYRRNLDARAQRFRRELNLKIRHNIAIMRAKSRPEVPAGLRDTFMIARVMGNDLHPRHSDGQMLKNLRFILENEPEFEGVTKLFVLNHIFNPDCHSAALELIEAHNAKVIDQPFIPEEYAALGWDLSAFGSADYFTSNEFLSMAEGNQLRAKIMACGPKLRYAMGVNGARNAAIQAGRTQAEWTAVLDGNCIFTKSSFERFRESCAQKPFMPYMVLPMHRLEENSDYFRQQPNLRSMEEPQIAFHFSANGEFDERFPYGMRDKTALLKSLGLPGNWQHWPTLAWIPDENLRMAERFQYRYSRGGVFRLSSGGSGLENKTAQQERYRSRNIAILTTISKLNELHGSAAPHLSALISNVQASSQQKGNPVSMCKRPSFDVAKAPDISQLNGRVLFIGLGAMKSGTSWVSDYLHSHPDVFHSPIKEMNFWNKLDPNQMQKFGSDFRLHRMKKILLKDRTSYPPSVRDWEKLLTLAELDNLNTTEEYLSYFARRIGSETHFGEICPQYSLMPARTYQRIAELGFDTRLMFFMRDPTERAASNIQHLLRRRSFDVDQFIEQLSPESREYQRSDYTMTLEAYRQSGVKIPLKTFFYEDLFNDNSIHEICEFMNLEFRQANFEKRVNEAKAYKVTQEQKQRIRERLDPIYLKLADYLSDKPAAWQW
ncbi:sulfotransferase [Ruegeria sp. SCP11]|uniref:sulfotransferase n=1 Tax=Ruegeria sp. SCP11 TaxID=3141378 RepID=UPI0033374E08